MCQSVTTVHVSGKCCVYIFGVKLTVCCICLLTLSEARILKEAMTCSAVSVSAVSRVMKSMKAWKVTTPVLLGSTRVMMRANSTSPCHRGRIVSVSTEYT